jgi:hypothetical protein
MLSPVNIDKNLKLLHLRNKHILLFLNNMLMCNRLEYLSAFLGSPNIGNASNIFA